MAAEPRRTSEEPLCGPLDGVRILDLTTVVMGPYATQILGDLGADVIKIETPPPGDTSRLMGGGPHPELSGVALNIHRNKRSIAIDLKRPDGLSVVRRLLATCDVFVTNLRPGPLRRLGLGYDDLAEAHPRLVYCQAQGFRIGSGDEDLPAYDDIIQAATGLARLSDATVGTTSFFPSIIADKVAGQTLATATLAALLHRHRTGYGQRVEVPMFDAIMAFNLVEHLSRATIEGQPAGYSRVLTRTRGPHPTSDGHIAMMPYTDDHWRRLFAAVGREDLLAEPWFADHRQRTIEAERVYGTLQSIVRERTTDEWMALCEAEGIPAHRVPTLDEIVNDPGLHRGTVETLEHPSIGPYRAIKAGMILDASPVAIRRAAPLHAEHTDEIMAEVGYSDLEIAALADAGAVTRRA